MIAESEIRDQMIAVLQGKLALDDLEAWLEAVSWNMHRDSAKAAQDLAAAVELAFFERSSGHRTNREVVERIEKLAHNVESRAKFSTAPVGIIQASRPESSHLFQVPTPKERLALA
jgi:hypothetical protein